MENLRIRSLCTLNMLTFWKTAFLYVFKCLCIFFGEYGFNPLMNHSRPVRRPQGLLSLLLLWLRWSSAPRILIEIKVLEIIFAIILEDCDSWRFGA